MKIKIFPTKEKAYSFTASLMAQLVQEKPNATFGILSDSDVINVYSFWAKMARAGAMDYSEVKLFNLTNQLQFETNHPKSDFNFLKKNLFSKLPKLKKSCTYFPTLDNNYEQQISEASGIDFQLLTLKADGSIGFNYEGTLAQSKSRKVVAISKSAAQGMTMGLETIMKAKKIVLLVLGKEKTEAFKKLKSLHKFDPNFPASILKKHDNLQVIVDEEAF